MDGNKLKQLTNNFRTRLSTPHLRPCEPTLRSERALTGAEPVYDSNLYSSKDKNGRSVTPFALVDMKDGEDNQKALKNIVQKNAITYKGSSGQYAMYSPGRWSDGSSVRDAPVWNVSVNCVSVRVCVCVCAHA